MLKKLTILILTLLYFIAPIAAQNKKIDQQKKVIAQLEQNIAKEEKQLARLKRDKASAEQQIESLTRQIEERNALIKETEEQIKELTVEVEASEARLEQLGVQHQELEESVGEIVRTAYRNYRYQNHLTYIFSAKSFTELAHRIAFLRVATLYRRTQIADVLSVRSDVQAEHNTLTKRRTELSKTKRQLDKQRTKLQSNIKEAKREIGKMSDKQKKIMRAKMNHEEQLNSAIKELRKLIKGNKTGGSFSKKLTGLKLPVENGKVKGYPNENMAEILGAEGAAVYSVYEGKVVEITLNKGNKKYDVYIAHGEYLTSYAGLSEVKVEKGATVKTNEHIGTIGKAINISTFELEYRIIFSIYAPSPDVTMSAAACFE